jgi:2-succinyl-5-enolpyruvyl-6-hydroxy-3-cyclohexene-1-carboxylate synthase
LRRASNVRIIVVNNGGGGEFRLSTSIGKQFGEDAHALIAATVHFGSAADWARACGFRHVGALAKAEVMGALPGSLAPQAEGSASMAIKVFGDFGRENQGMIAAQDGGWRATAKRVLPLRLERCARRLLRRH